MRHINPWVSATALVLALAGCASLPERSPDEDELPSSQAGAGGNAGRSAQGGSAGVAGRAGEAGTRSTTSSGAGSRADGDAGSPGQPPRDAEIETCRAAEQCGNEIDDDCDMWIDEGCDRCAVGATRACYPGDAELAGVGACTMGSQRCETTATEGRTHWGTCTGSVAPANEDCSSTADEDCDGVVDEGCRCIPDQERACYTGDESTRAVGACRDGTQRCALTGDVVDWTTCAGDVTPRSETCEGSADEDCDTAVDEGCACTADSHLEPSPWGDCSGFGSACDTSGTRSRSVPSCVDGVIVAQAESEACSRVTEGLVVAGNWGSCMGFSDACDASGTRSRTDEVCVDGAATEQVETESCTRVVGCGCDDAHPCPCLPSQFDCGDGQCIPGSYECDIFVDCTNGHDEAPLNAGCESSGGSGGSGGMSGSGGTGGTGTPTGPCDDQTGAGTAVSGIVNGATWSAAGSPYRVTGDVLVAGLTIEPGVCVLLDEGHVFEVAGQLDAQGTSDDPIVFTGTDWGGIFFNSSQSSTLAGCIVEGSINSGIRITESSPLIEGCVIRDNEAVSGGGLRIEGGAPVILNARIENNVGTDSFTPGGGIYVAGGCVSVANTIIANNYSVYANARGGGVHVCGGNVLIANSTIVDNGGTVYGDGSGGIAVNSSLSCSNNSYPTGTAYITSSIIYGNVGSQVIGSSPNTIVEYSAVQGGFTGTGNISTNPIFADADYHLLDGASAAIDAGDPDAARNDGCLPPGLGGARNDMGAWGGPGNCADGSGALSCEVLAPASLITEFQSPGSACTGLAWDGAALWIEDNLRHVYQVDAQGSVLSSFTVPDSIAMGGLAWDGSGFWTASYSYPIKLGLDGRQLDHHPDIDLWYSNDRLAWDGTDFWWFESNSRVIRRYDVNQNIELAWANPDYGVVAIAADADSLWALLDYDEELVRYDHLGEEQERIPLDHLELDLSGGEIAWDGATMWICAGFQVYRVDIGYGSQAPSNGCSAGQIACGNGTCTVPAQFCDVDDDCGNAFDEANCACPEHTCGDGECLRSSQVCNNVQDCTGGSDEVGCPCSSSEFTCPDGECIMNGWVCDGITDCTGGADEQGC